MLAIKQIKAKERVVKTLETYKAEGRQEIDIIDIHTRTHLPFAQINTIMTDLEEEGRVTEVD